MIAVPIFWLFYLLCLFYSRIVVNITECDDTVVERFSAIKPGSIHHFLHLKMPLPSQEYDSCCPFVWYVLSFDFTIWLGTFRLNFPRSSVFLWDFTLYKYILQIPKKTQPKSRTQRALSHENTCVTCKK